MKREFKQVSASKHHPDQPLSGTAMMLSSRPWRNERNKLRTSVNIDIFRNDSAGKRCRRWHLENSTHWTWAGEQMIISKKNPLAGKQDIMNNFCIFRKESR